MCPNVIGQRADGQGDAIPMAASKPGSRDKPLELMLCNIPCKLEHCDIVKAINEAGFAGEFDLVHVPRPRKMKSKTQNLGYAFVNLNSQENAARFVERFFNYQFPGTTSKKRCIVKPAHMQDPLLQEGSAKTSDTAEIDTDTEQRSSQIFASKEEEEGRQELTECKSSVMLCDIPHRVGNADIVEELNDTGFADLCDFVYVSKCTSLAFVHFKSPEDAACFVEIFQTFHFRGSDSNKRCVVKFAHDEEWTLPKDAWTKPGFRAQERAEAYRLYQKARVFYRAHGSMSDACT